MIGEIIDIDKGLNNLGNYLESKFNNKKENNISIAEGFITSSLLFCVGAMTIVGALESGLKGNHDTLFTKSVLDLVSSIIFTSSLGIDVIFAAITIIGLAFNMLGITKIKIANLLPAIFLPAIFQIF